jgi:hypothetical protein
MRVFEKRGTRPGYIQVNLNLWIFVIVCLCIATGLAVFFAIRDPIENSAEDRVVKVLAYHNPGCFDHVAESVTYFHDGSRKIEMVSCGVRDWYTVTDRGVEYAKDSPNNGKPLARR